MCKCNPNIRTPFCGKIGCQWPKKDGEKETNMKKTIEQYADDILLQLDHHPNDRKFIIGVLAIFQQETINGTLSGILKGMK